MKAVIIQGSSRSQGNTHKIAQVLQKHLDADIIDLKQHQIHAYSYEHEHNDDDFLPLMKRIVTYDTIIFATPVYWYAMSGMMKNFFDRITDCLKTEKETGRQLRGKSMSAISCGSEATAVEGFFVPFRNSAEYLGMNYLGDLHTWVASETVDEQNLALIRAFVETKLK